MVGVVIVSHSRSLGDALVDLVRQVTATEIPLAVAAGVGPEREEFGTDAVEIMEAIQSVYSPDGVLLLMDLGSAILSAEMALELLPPEMVEKVRFCAAPLVEGAIAAGVQVGLGSDIDTICEEARTALLPKIEHISGAQGVQLEGVLVSEVGAAPRSIAQAEEEIVLTLNNLHGLHARPAARFVQTAAGFDASIQVKNETTGKGPVSAKSLNALATLGAVHGHQILVSASGVEAHRALTALQELVEDNFGEPPEVAEEIPKPIEPKEFISKIEGAVQAVPVSEGVALGPVYTYKPSLPPIPQELVEDPEKEWQRLMDALEITKKAIQGRSKQLANTIGETESAIFEAHLLILQDPDLIAQVRHLIFKEHKNAAAAWNQIIVETAGIYQALDDPYQQQRAADVRDVGNQVLFALADRAAVPKIELKEQVILFAHELTPTETSQLDMGKVIGLITIGGGPTSHSAILARALGIPAVTGAGIAFEKITDGTLLAIDGYSGNVWVDPPVEVKEEIRVKRAEWKAKRERLLLSSHEPGITQDGHKIEVAANIGSVLDAEAALRNGAEAVGLLRTEFLFLTRETPPTEDEQLQMLCQIGEALHADNGPQRPIILRTLDVGGDKELPYLAMPPEANPFLGVRAIRLSLRSPDLFKTQLRAVLRAAESFKFRIMYPMVANLDEVIEARQFLEEAHLSLQADGIAHGWPIETGIMVEIPSAALLSAVLAPHVDFFSIGTNDLTQYTLAAERGNPQLPDLADALHPAVLRLVQGVVDSAHHHSKWVGVCGELAGDPLAVPILVGLGVDELSMNPDGIPRAKAVLRAIMRSEVEELGSRVLNTRSAEEAREMAREYFDKHIQDKMP